MKKKLSLFSNRNCIYYIVFFIIAIILDYIFIGKLKGDQFLFIHDQFFKFSSYESFNSLFIRVPENFSVLNGWYFAWYFWDTLYYLTIYAIKLSPLQAEILLFFTVLFLSMCISFEGFKKLAEYFDKKIEHSKIFIVTLWYCFNPFTLIIWHTGNYNLGFSLTFSLVPLIIYYHHLSMFSKTNKKNIVILALLLFASTPVFWLFAALLFYIILYTLIYLLLNKSLIINFIKNLFFLLLVYIPLASFVIFSIMYEFYGKVGDSNAAFLPTFGLQQGGIKYQLLLLSSWAIYTPWNPRSIFSFGWFYFTKYYLYSTLSLYFIILSGITIHLINRLKPEKNIFKRIKHFSLNKQDIVLISTSILLTIAIFFAKAEQPPFGKVFLYLYNHVPLFSVFRSADQRFGFLIVVAIAFLLIYTSKYFNKYLFSLSILTIILVQNIHFFNGKAVMGENIENLFYDRIIYYSNNHKNVIKFLNNESGAFGYILTIPSVQFGQYSFDGNENFIGQDILPKNIKSPFVYLLESECTAQQCGIYKKTNQQLSQALKSNDISNIKKFPIKYIIKRSDMNCSNCFNLPEKTLNDNFRKVFENNIYKIYEINGYSPFINIDNSSLSFTYINPIKYKLKIRNLKHKKNLNFLLSYNSSWKLFLNKYNESNNCEFKKIIKDSSVTECTSQYKFFEGEEIKYLWQNQIFDTSHKIKNGYANTWNVDSEYIKNNFNKEYYKIHKDGSIDIDMTIYFLPQSWLYLTLIISSLTLAGTGIFLSKNNYNKISKKNKKDE